jgi:two-component system nitrate/nitrite response regulator NarL
MSPQPATLAPHEGPGPLGVVIRILVVGDVRLHREGVAALLARDRRIGVVATAGSGENLARAAHIADVALVDTAGEDGVGVLRRTAAATSLPIVALGTPGADDQVIAFAEAGVLGFVEQEATVDDLRVAVECASRAEASCPPRIATTLLRRLTTLSGVQRPVGEPGTLTRRELQILQLIDEGLTNKEIAQRLFIEVATVKNHVHHILEKLKVSRRGEAAARMRLVEETGSSQLLFPAGVEGSGPRRAHA